MERSKEEIFEFLKGKMTFEKKEIKGYLHAYGITEEPPVVDVFETLLGAMTSSGYMKTFDVKQETVSLEDLVDFMENEEEEEEPCVYIVFSETLDDDENGVMEEIIGHDMNFKMSIKELKNLRKSL